MVYKTQKIICSKDTDIVSGHAGKHGKTLSQEEIETWRDPAIYISIAFGSPRKVQKWECPGCIDVPRPVRIYTLGTGKQVPRYIVLRLADDSLVVAFSGTDVRYKESIGINLDLRLASLDPVQFPGCEGRGVKVHSGFLDCFNKLKNELLGVVRREVDLGVRGITLAGYSLGLAFISGLWLKSRLPAHIPVELLGYGCPRIGNRSWSDVISQQFGDSAKRLVNYKDVVCRIPPPFLGYRHAGKEIFISKDGQTYSHCDDIECNKCSGRFDSKRGWIKLFHSLRRVEELLHYGPYAGVMLHPDLYISTTSVNGIQDDAQLQSKVSTHVVGSDSMGGKTSLDPE